MNKFYEIIFTENQKLKQLNLDDICSKIFDYLNTNYQIKFLKIYVNKKDNIQNLFNNSQDDKEYIFTTFKFKQNDEREVIFSLLFLSQEEQDKIKDKLDFLKISLNTFSQSLFIKYLEKVLKDMAIIDNLTGNYNRYYLYNHIEPLFNLSDRRNEKIAFLKVGIDHFEAVIDEFNYKIGDKVVKILSKIIKETVRKSDIVIRMSNDGHLIILPNIENSENAILVANKLLEKFNKEKIIINEETNQVLMKTISVGITIYPDDGTDIDTIIRKSDIALYEAENKGRAEVLLFTEKETNKIELF